MVLYIYIYSYFTSPVFLPLSGYLCSVSDDVTLSPTSPGNIDVLGWMMVKEVGFCVPEPLASPFA